ncbi:J domain-containing protein [Thermosynechococcus sp. QKsg1]|uniref:J domain-containing protein n=1 Tax=Thermosynechococcus sp. QKsg1 TaxID=3074130 RepID=UPI0028775A0A|nr:J domain-containing protein [Thermosynechococcus sp. QKsg1]WNC86817.1 J domain-containing protein [Thermosynechococcus sp. QKsg1]
MTDYYDILGLQPGASKEQIKAAYRRLCQECHPDKLPPETPKKARQIVEEHFKQINEAYAYLMEQGDRPPPPTQPATDVRTARSIFDPARMEAVARKLETERQTIQRQYQQSINAIDQQQRQKLACHGLKINDKETEAAKAAAAQKKERRLQEQSSYIRRHIDYFKTLPLEMLSESFVQNLSDEDQFFLLLAIKEKEDDKQWARTVAAGVEIAAAAGVVLLLS